jgi:hypothetical protein
MEINSRDKRIEIGLEHTQKHTQSHTQTNQEKQEKQRLLTIVRHLSLIGALLFFVFIVFFVNTCHVNNKPNPPVSELEVY